MSKTLRSVAGSAQARSRSASDAFASKQADVLETYAQLRALHPDAHCELDHNSPFQLLVATVLSAQSTDKMVNVVTPALFSEFPTAQALARAPVEHVEQLIGRLGFFRAKAKNIVSLSQSLVLHHGGEVPQTMDALTALAGVGRKTANVVLGNCFGKAEGVVVDTHVQRISQRLGWTAETTPEKIEPELTALFPASERDMVSHVLIFHGRRICFAQRPACTTCGVRARCPSADHAELIGRKPPKTRAHAPSASTKKSAAEKPVAKTPAKKAPAARKATAAGAAAAKKIAPAAPVVKKRVTKKS